MSSLRFGWKSQAEQVWLSIALDPATAKQQQYSSLDELIDLLASRLIADQQVTRLTKQYFLSTIHHHMLMY